jgi:hypothetical protein
MYTNPYGEHSGDALFDNAYNLVGATASISNRDQTYALNNQVIAYMDSIYDSNGSSAATCSGSQAESFDEKCVGKGGSVRTIVRSLSRENFNLQEFIQ